MSRQQFKALVDFTDPDTRSEYCRGLKYHVREGNDKLAVKVAKWVDQDKVVLIHGPVASVAGKGETV